MLTYQQANLLRFISEHIASTAAAPSLSEMAEHLGHKTKSRAHQIVVGLEQRGFVRRLPRQARGIEVIKLPENMGGRSPAVLAERERCARVAEQCGSRAIAVAIRSGHDLSSSIMGEK